MLKTSKRGRPGVGGLGSSRSSKLLGLLFIGLFSIIGGYIIFKSFASPVLPHRGQDFSADPNWQSASNRPDPTIACTTRAFDFGYSATANAGGTQGEIGGTFADSQQYRAYYGVNLVNFKTFGDTLTASGKLDIPASSNGNVLIGWYDAAHSVGWPTSDFIGFRINGSGASAKAILEFGSDKGMTNSGRALPSTLKLKTKYTWQLSYTPSSSGGTVKLTIDNKSVSDSLTTAQKADGADFNHFGFLSYQAPGGSLQAFMDDLTINGTVYGFDKDPLWDAANNKLPNANDCWVPNRQDFGFSNTHNAGGIANGEAGGFIFRSLKKASYGDTTNSMSLKNSLYATARVNLVNATANSDFYLGWYNDGFSKSSATTAASFVGAHITGPSATGPRIYPELIGGAKNKATADPAKSPIMMPLNIPRNIWVCYQPNFDAAGNGKLSLGIEADSIHNITAKSTSFLVDKSVISKAINLDRFGIRTNQGTPAGSAVFYMDDLSYTSASGDFGPSDRCGGTNSSTGLQVSITAPVKNATVSGNSVPVTATATSSTGIGGVKFFADNAQIGDEDMAAPYSVNWNTLSLSNGKHTLKATVYDSSSSNHADSTPVTVTVKNAGTGTSGDDHTKPTVSITAPKKNTTVSGSSVSITATATDSSGIAGVQFYLDGVSANNKLCAEDTTSPYSCTWNTTTLANGKHTLAAIARDASTAGNTQTSKVITVTVNNSGSTTGDTTPPSVPAGLKAKVTATSVALSWKASKDNTGGTGVAGYKVYRDGVFKTSTTKLTYTDSGLTAGQTYKYSVTAFDNANPANESAKSPEVSASIGSGASTGALNITSPVANAYLKGTANITVTAAAGSSFKSVKILVNNKQTGDTLATAPYSLSWDTTKVKSKKNGYNLEADGTDSSNKVVKSKVVTVSVDNDKPSATITKPSANTAKKPLTGKTPIVVSAKDSVGVAGVQIKIDGNLLGTEITKSPYSLTWDTASFTQGKHDLTATARDFAGNTADSKPVSVTLGQQTCTDTVAPPVPANLVASNISDTSVTLNWGAVTDTGCSGLAGYAIYRDGTLLNTVTGTTFTDDSLAAGTTYQFTVLAFDVAGNQSAQSPAVSVTASGSGGGTGIPGDVNGDGQVDLDDLDIVLTNFGQTTSNGDANGDGIVNLDDLDIVLTNFGT